MTILYLNMLYKVIGIYSYTEPNKFNSNKSNLIITYFGYELNSDKTVKTINAINAEIQDQKIPENWIIAKPNLRFDGGDSYSIGYTVFGEKNFIEKALYNDIFEGKTVKI